VGTVLSTTFLEILSQLNHVSYTDGTTIGNALGITRAAVWKAIQKLQSEYHIEIESHRSHGYRLVDPLIMLDQQFISGAINHKDVLVECFPSINSTNTYLQNASLKFSYHICIAEQQTRGKGRFNRVWVSPFAENLYYSLKVNLNKELSELSGLSLAVAVGVTKALVQSFTELNPKIKWPNDIYVNGKKMAGILIEVKAESNAQSQIVIGVGINVNMRKNDTVTQAWSSLATELKTYINRNTLAITLSNELITTLKAFEKEGFAYFMDDYHHYDYLKGKSISLSILNKEVVSGVWNGVNELGQLKLKIGENEQRVFASGEATIIKR
jgi:BirA family biotin operon repressor/biotin-[acetyl-CoA-carboxylase] ligase